MADNPQLGNPLERLRRMGTAWMGAIFELEGVLVEDTEEMHKEAWRQVAQQYGKPPPALFQLRRAEGMKNEQIVSEVLNYAREPSIVKAIVQCKERIYEGLLGGRKIQELPKARFLLDVLATNDTPCALVSSSSEHRVLHILQSTGLESYFDTVLCAEDVQYGKPDPEIYIYAAQGIQRPPERCVVIGSSNKSVEAAHEVGMQCLAVVGRNPVYEFAAADLVVRKLDELSFVNLKQLFRMEKGTKPQLEQQPQPQPQPEAQTASSLLDFD